MKTDRTDLTADEIWRTYILLTRGEDAFRDIKCPLMERPIFHHLQHRTQTHIFVCVLAYHLLAAIEHRFLQHGVHTSWWTLRQGLNTHQVVTVVLPAADGRVLRIRKGTSPEPPHREIYEILGIPRDREISPNSGGKRMPSRVKLLTDGKTGQGSEARRCASLPCPAPALFSGTLPPIPRRPP